MFDHSFLKQNINFPRLVKLINGILPCYLRTEVFKPDLESACLLKPTGMHSLNKNKKKRKKNLL